MIISVADLKKYVDTGNTTDERIRIKLDAIESVIRTYTHNNFQQREIRFSGPSDGSTVYGSPRFFTVGDTVQITSDYGVNDGLYVVTAVHDDCLELDKELQVVDHNLVTRIKYPADVVRCVVKLFRWELTNGEKIGIKSETLSRHSVTYEDSETLFMGYPIGILNGLLLYRKARC